MQGPCSHLRTPSSGCAVSTELVRVVRGARRVGDVAGRVAEHVIDPAQVLSKLVGRSGAEGRASVGDELVHEGDASRRGPSSLERPDDVLDLEPRRWLMAQVRSRRRQPVSVQPTRRPQAAREGLDQVPAVCLARESGQVAWGEPRHRTGVAARDRVDRGVPNACAGDLQTDGEQPARGRGRDHQRRRGANVGSASCDGDDEQGDRHEQVTTQRVSTRDALPQRAFRSVSRAHVYLLAPRPREEVFLNPPASFTTIVRGRVAGSPIVRQVR